MDLDDYPLLSEPNVMLLALKAATLAPAVPEDCLRQLEKSLRQIHKELPADMSALQHRVATAFHYLCIAGLLDPDEDGRGTITQRGKDMLRDYPKGIDSSVLVAFPEFRSFIHNPRSLSPQASDEPPVEPAREYDEGYSAGSKGGYLTDNPYDFETLAHLEWENGWCEAQDEIFG